MDIERSSGLLLHMTSLPSRFGIGDLGPSAYRFVDACVHTQQRMWQILPICPVAFGYSPYASPSTFAGNPLMISPEQLVSDGLLTREQIASVPDFPEGAVNYERIIPYKIELLTLAWERFEANGTPTLHKAFEFFCTENAEWLSDYALFAALKEYYGKQVWTQWPAPLAHRKPEAIEKAQSIHAAAIRRRKCWQFLFARQWEWLHTYCRNKNVAILGDLPIYVAHDSADVWSSPDLFWLDDTGEPTVVGGVPPDFFSNTGQRWGNPLYRWDMMARNDYAWWTARLRRALFLSDVVRLDHFRGFAAYWEVPAAEQTAVNGRWVKGPGATLFEHLQTRLGVLPILAENLGIITQDVTDLMHRFDFPGMSVLQFGFGHDTSNKHLPHNYTPRMVAYTGTHDNDTLAGWWNTATENERTFARRYLNLTSSATPLNWQSIRMLMASRARLVVTPVQDVLGLPGAARMNTPGTVADNWQWRLLPDELENIFREPGIHLRNLTQVYGRAH